MYCHGTTSNGTQRWLCPLCHTTKTVQRPDTTIRNYHTLFISWLTSVRSLSDLAKERGWSVKTAERHFMPFWNEVVPPPFPTSSEHLVLDATYVHGTTTCVLVIMSETGLWWRFVDKESTQTWYDFLTHFPPPLGITADGLHGIKRAVLQAFSDTIPLQRCQFHVIAQVRKQLLSIHTNRFVTQLRNHVYSMDDVYTPTQRDRWILWFRLWCQEYKHSPSLQHPAIDKARTTIQRALPYLFVYINDPALPNTTGVLEGGVNAHIAEALRRHRGLSVQQQRVLISVILSTCGIRVPKRNKKESFSDVYT